MYSLIVTNLDDGMMPGDRMLESTDARLREYFAPNGSLDPTRLVGVPALVTPEISASESGVARVGCVRAVTAVRVGRGFDYKFSFDPYPEFLPIPSAEILSAANELGIAQDTRGGTYFGELHRNHWIVKDNDLIAGLTMRRAPMMPRVFTLKNHPADSSLVAVMMPFDASFSPIFAALTQVITSEGWSCKRADDIWINDAIIQDVVDLIGEARVVICDLTGKNPNVFYEAGIAHTMGKDVVLLTQSADDVPFDLRHLRYVSYLANDQGLNELQTKVAARLQTLMGVS